MFAGNSIMHTRKKLHGAIADTHVTALSHITPSPAWHTIGCPRACTTLRRHAWPRTDGPGCALMRPLNAIGAVCRSPCNPRRPRRQSSCSVLMHRPGFSGLGTRVPGPHHRPRRRASALQARMPALPSAPEISPRVRPGSAPPMSASAARPGGVMPAGGSGRSYSSEPHQFQARCCSAPEA